METLVYALSGAAFFLWIAAVMFAVLNSQRVSEAAVKRGADEPSGNYRWQFE